MHAEQHWKPMSPAKTLSTNKRSMEALFSLKIISSIVTSAPTRASSNFNLIDHVLRTLSAKTAICSFNVLGHVLVDGGPTVVSSVLA